MISNIIKLDQWQEVTISVKKLTEVNLKNLREIKFISDQGMARGDQSFDVKEMHFIKQDDLNDMTINEMLLRLQEYYTQAFSERPAARISNLVSLNTGWETDVYSFHVDWGAQTGDAVTAGAAQSEDLILRVYPGADAADKSQREYAVLRVLHQQGYPVPRVDRLERAASPFGKPFLIMERIEGESMWLALVESGSQRQDQVLAQFCGLFARLHQLDWRPLLGSALTGSEADFAPGPGLSLVEQQMERWRPFIAAMPLPGFQANWGWLVDHHRDIPSIPPSLIHWDFHPNNILLTPTGSACVIDWAGAEISDYRFDLAWTLLLMSSEIGQPWGERVLREYERQAGRQVEDLEFFSAVAAFRRLYSVVGSLTFGADQLGMRPGAEAQMRRSAPALRIVYEQLLGITGLSIPEVEVFLNGV